MGEVGRGGASTLYIGQDSLPQRRKLEILFRQFGHVRRLEKGKQIKIALHCPPVCPHLIPARQHHALIISMQSMEVIVKECTSGNQSLKK